MSSASTLRATLLAGAVLTASSFGAAAATVNYGLLTTIAIPASTVNSQGGAFNSFDISYVDPVTGNYYVADRSNASVDIFSGTTNTFLGRAEGFVGQKATTSVSGPDGVVVVDVGGVATLYAGDGGSTLRSFNVTDPTHPVAGGVVNTGGGSFRVDEMAYSPATKSLLVANNANSPAYATLISTATALSPTLTKPSITVPGQVASGGLEQSVWNPTTGTYFVSVPTFNGTDAGGVQEYDVNGNPLRTYSFSSMGITGCSPAGLVLGASGNLTVGCGNSGTQTVVLDPAGAGTIVAKLAAVSGSDELWYDPASGNIYVTGVNAAGDRVIDVFSDSTYALLQSIDLTSLGAGTSNLHSVAVDPLNGEIFVPLTGTTSTFTDALCPSGCIAVFAEAVPEPGSFAIIAAALVGLTGLAGWRRNGV